VTHSWIKKVRAVSRAMAKIPFQVIPVLDIQNGQAVHAVGGRRAYYQPLQSILHASSEPISLAHALRDSLGLQSLYLADLDAIEGGRPLLDIYRKIVSLGFHIWIDAGIRNVESLVPLLDLDPASSTIIAGLETVEGPRELTEIVNHAGTDRVVFSLDLFEGSPRMPARAVWGTEDPRELAQAAIDCGAGHLLILDLARVGTSRGLGTHSLFQQIREGNCSVTVTAGGGISRIEEIVDLREAGAASVLIGSAIHDGRIGALELEWLGAGEV
jgi:phosphoribosylformimino-5-aminoimidazole carboxamide ribotide isomerase